MAQPSNAAAFLILFPLLLCAQKVEKEVVIRTHPYTPPSTILHAESNLVEAGLTVRDSRGRAVGGPHGTDSEILYTGAPQRIAAFSELRPDGKPLVAASAPDSGNPPETVPPANAPPS